MTDRVLPIGLYLGLTVLVLSVALLFLLPKESPEFVVTVLSAFLSLTFIGLVLLTMRILKRKRQKLYEAISEMANERIDSVDSICKPGDVMRVKCIDIDNIGRVRLSRKAALNDEAAAE